MYLSNYRYLNKKKNPTANLQISEEKVHVQIGVYAVRHFFYDFHDKNFSLNKINVSETTVELKINL